MWIGEPKYFRWLFGIVSAVLVLNLPYAVFRVFWYVHGAATEANPLIDTLIREGPLPFVL